MGLVDVCRVLEIGNSRDAAARLDDDDRGVGIIDTLGGNPKGWRLCGRRREGADW